MLHLSLLSRLQKIIEKYWDQPHFITSMMILQMQFLYVLQKYPTNSFCPFK